MVDGVALTRHRKRDVLALYVGCDKHRCPGSWTSGPYRGVVDRVRGLRRLAAAN